MLKPKQIIIFLAINAILTGGAIYLFRHLRFEDIFFTFCIYLPVIFQLILGKNLLYKLNNTLRKIETGIMLLSAYFLNSIFLNKSDYYDDFEIKSFYLRDELSNLISILIIYYLIVALTEWFLFNNKTKNNNETANIINSSKIESVQLLLNLKKEGKISSEHFEEEIEKLTK